MWGDVLENLKPSDLRITPGLATLRRDPRSAGHIMLAQDAPTNQQILDGTKRFYGQHQALIEAPPGILVMLPPRVRTMWHS